jgi:hypothetical protein
MNLDNLRISDAMTSDYIRETNYVDVSKYKHLRITSFSDCDLILYISFSHDGSTTGPTYDHPMKANQWATRRVDIILPYIRLRIVRNEGVVNTMLIVNSLGRYTPESVEKIVDKPVDNEMEPVKDEQPQQRSKSPFRSLMTRKKSVVSQSNPSSQISVNDPRLPNYISKGCLLIGGFSGSVITVNPPDAGVDSHLCFIDGSFVWTPISEKRVVWKV